jgi:hypothetical protein
MNRLLVLALAAGFVSVTAEVRAEKAAPSAITVSPTSFAFGLDGWLTFQPDAGRPDLAFGYGLYGRYRVHPHLSLGAAVTRFRHDDIPCYDSYCTAPATLLLATARYHGAEEGEFDPWIQLGVGAGISDEPSYLDLDGSHPYDHPPLDRVAVCASFEGKIGFDTPFFALLKIGPAARVFGFGDPYRLFAGVDVHVEARW